MPAVLGPIPHPQPHEDGASAFRTYQHGTPRNTRWCMSCSTSAWPASRTTYSNRRVHWEAPSTPNPSMGSVALSRLAAWSHWTRTSRSINDRVATNADNYAWYLTNKYFSQAFAWWTCDDGVGFLSMSPARAETAVEFLISCRWQQQQQQYYHRNARRWLGRRCARAMLRVRTVVSHTEMNVWRCSLMVEAEQSGLEADE